MAIATGLAIAAGVSAAAGIGGAVIGSKAQKKAAASAAQTAANTTASNNALALNIYGQNKATLAPFVGAGTQATGQINSLLGLGTTPKAQQQQYQNAFKNFQNSTGYQFRVGEGQRVLDNSFASRGVGQSGAAAKRAIQYGQDMGSGEFGNYFNALAGQQGVGLSAAGAQAGVSTNFVNQTTANNNSASSAAANAAIAQGNATGNMWAGIGNSVGGAVGNIFGSSFGGGGANAYGIRAGNIY